MGQQSVRLTPASAEPSRSLELGVNVWDSAMVYRDMLSERVIGSVWDKVSRERSFFPQKAGAAK